MYNISDINYIMNSLLVVVAVVVVVEVGVVTVDVVVVAADAVYFLQMKGIFLSHLSSFHFPILDFDGIAQCSPPELFGSPEDQYEKFHADPSVHSHFPSVSKSLAPIHILSQEYRLRRNWFSSWERIEVR